MVTSWAWVVSLLGRTSCPPPVHEAGFVGVTDGVIEPIPFRYVGERKRSFRKGDGHRHLAVGHGEGIGARKLSVTATASPKRSVTATAPTWYPGPGRG